ncbi:hypothetical protein WH52_03760 [Tenacibaculum holothuriorum]|uniref:Uncharacterized protein n=1 Tax=Tenacibaculum holothuriorum TaxID=1635173 RepID=A0A1Y2PE85_9FLAO|nr:hypothetical protein [Tenacibaculum holothuriorum]OSY88793.1 hypothetical protein WH52_03760 [Tenacibaculum holothuriorum]
MTFKLTTYKTLTGTKKILELPRKKNTEAIIYQDDKPAFHVDCFDLQTESNLQMNSLVLAQKRNIVEVIEEIGKKNNVNLSIKEKPFLAIEKESKLTEVELPPLPEAWLN